MAKFHIGENGPAQCRATSRPCPIGGEHFENEEDANKSFQETMKSRETVFLTKRGPMSGADFEKDKEFTNEFNEQVSNPENKLDHKDLSKEFLPGGHFVDKRYPPDLKPEKPANYKLNVYKVNVKGKDYYAAHHDVGLGNSVLSDSTLYSSQREAENDVAIARIEWFNQWANAANN